jgi:hypothetical protein
MSTEKKDPRTVELEAKKKAYLEAKKNEPKTVEIEVEGFTCKLRKPDRGIYTRVIGLITPLAGKDPEIVRAGSLILESCWLSGDEELKTEDDLNISACLKAVELIEIKEANLKKN